MKKCFFPANIMLPDFKKVDGTKWSVIACDQHTSEPEYWEAAKEISKDSPTTLELILPEVYLSETETRVPKINATMKEYIKIEICLENFLNYQLDQMLFLGREL